MTLHRFFLIPLGCLCLVAILSGQSAQVVRTWVDQTGRTVKGKLLDVQGPNVILQLENNTSVTVPVIRFSTADQAFVKEWAKSARKPDPSLAGLPLKWPENVAVDAKKLEITVGAQDPAARQYIYQSGSFQFTSNAQLTGVVMREIAGDFELVKSLIDKLPWGWQSKPEGGGPFFLAVLHETENDYISAGGDDTSSGRSQRGIIFTKFSTLGLKKVGERYARDTKLNREGEMTALISRLVMGEMRSFTMPWAGIGFETFLEEIAYRNGAFQMTKLERGMKEYLIERNKDGLAPDADAMVKILHMTSEEDKGREDLDARRFNRFHGAMLVYYLGYLDGDGTGARLHRYYQQVAQKATAWRDYQEARKVGKTAPNPLTGTTWVDAAVELNNTLIDGRSDAQIRADMVAKFKAIGVKL
jgi:hypothetical protein